MEATQSTKRRGRPPKVEAKVEEPAIPAAVIQTTDNLDMVVTRARQSNVSKLMVTADVLAAILMDNYKNDPYMIYRNVELHDWEKMDETERRNAMNKEQVVFGNSKVKIQDSPNPAGPTPNV